MGQESCTRWGNPNILPCMSASLWLSELEVAANIRYFGAEVLSSRSCMKKYFVPTRTMLGIEKDGKV